MKQKILLLTTLDISMRSQVDSMHCEDGDLIRMDKEIGLSGSMHCPFYQTVMHAIGDGWRLMAPPVFEPEYCMSDKGYISAYNWWLEK